METKLTLSMEKEVIEAAKKYARKKNTSLSKLIKNYLVSVTSASNTEADITPLVKSLSGILAINEKNKAKNSYADFLSKKYQ